ncbi:hypothetical protein X732_18620 [Mesorhizobium sp. L2C066B000]|nr:hypothetical protein X732_18620 [Mesorhizobium sp. L2C066B000]
MQIGQHRAVGKQTEPLVDDAEAVLACSDRAVDGDYLVADTDGAAVGPEHAGKHLHQRRLAGAAFTDDSMDRPLSDRQVHIP